jgi:hypothetical protein
MISEDPHGGEKKGRIAKITSESIVILTPRPL